jgi:proline dehydrogenase
MKRSPRRERWAYARARRYHAGLTLDDAVTHARELDRQGFRVSLDRVGEHIADPSVAERVTAEYVELARAAAALPRDPCLSVDCSHIGLDVSPGVCRANLERMLGAVPDRSRLIVNAEDSERVAKALPIVAGLGRAGAAIVATVQANLRRSQRDAVELADAGVPVRLVKGAYVEPRSVAWPWGPETDHAFLRLGSQLLDARSEILLASHDETVLEPLLERAPQTTVELILGIRTDYAHGLRRRGVDVMIYATFGEGWFNYWMRRVAEARGA